VTRATVRAACSAGLGRCDISSIATFLQPHGVV